MTKQLLLFWMSIFMLSNLSSTQGQAIHSAFELRTYLTKDGTLQEGTSDARVKAFYALLASHLQATRDSVNNPTTLTHQQILAAYDKNPFISPFLTDDLLQSLAGNVVDLSKIRANARGSLDPLGTGLGVPGSTFLLGLTDFLVERTKQELNIAFFIELRKALEKSEEMRFLFPKTKEVLLKIDDNIYQFKAFWELLRESFLMDLDNLVYNLDDYVQLSNRIKDPLARHLMSDFFKVTELIYDKTTPANVITYLAENSYLQVLDSTDDKTGHLKVIQDHVKVLGVISKSLEQKEGNGYWVDPQRVVDLLRDPVTVAFYLGFLYEEGKTLTIGTQTLAQHLSLLVDNTDRTRQLLNTFKLFLNEASKLERLADNIRTQNNSSRRNRNSAPKTAAEIETEHQNYFNFTQGVCELILYANTFKRELMGPSPMDSLVTRYLSIVGDLNTITLEINRQQYTSALVHSLFVIEKLLPQDSFQCQRQTLLKYGTFIATAVGAKTPEEVSNVIAAFALPPGSSAMKKYSKFSIALNAFVGISGGQETLNNGLGTNPYYAIATPIGVSFNMGFNNYGSVGVLASLIDIGALTSLRFQDNSASDLPDLKIENVFAPGAYLVYAIPKYPIAIGVGAQLGPNLRSVTDNNLNVVQASGWRWGAFLAVDIPIVSFYNSSRRYKNCPKRR
ncbi:MAG: hypothetical protein ACRBFS_16440 [Aureispira sp.]